MGFQRDSLKFMIKLRNALDNQSNVTLLSIGERYGVPKTFIEILDKTNNWSNVTLSLVD